MGLRWHHRLPILSRGRYSGDGGVTDDDGDGKGW